MHTRLFPLDFIVLVPTFFYDDFDATLISTCVRKT